MTGRALPTLGSSDPWAGGVVTSAAQCVLAPNPSAWTLDGTNTWLLTSGNDVIVVDPGPDDADHLARVCAAIGRRHHVATLLTHGHADHSAGARTLFRMTGVEVRALDPEHRYGGAGLHEGDTIAFGDRVLRVIHTAGHSSDSLCFALDDLLLTGDTVLGRGTAAIIWPDGQLGAYLASLSRLADEFADVNLLLPGHGPVLTDPGAVLAGYLAHRRARLKEIREAAASGANSVGALMDVIYPDVPVEIRPGAERSLRAHIAYLAERQELSSTLLG